jgi:hypothetical protein
VYLRKLMSFAVRLRKRCAINVAFQICVAGLVVYSRRMTKTKNPTQSIALRLSVNLSLDDVGLERLYQELRDIETGASGLAPIQVHALKRRHLLKILHAYCADANEPSRLSSNADSAKLTPKMSSVEEPIFTKATQPISLPIIETIRQEHPPPMINSEADRALLDIGLGFKSQT